MWCGGRIARVLDADDGGIEPKPRRLAGAIERAEVHPILPDGIDGAWTGDRVRDEGLDHQAREPAVAVGEHLVAERVVAVFGELVLDRVVAVRRQHIGTEPIAAALDRRQKRSHRLAADVVARHQMIFERDRVELPRDRVAFGLRCRKCGCSARPPA